MQIQIRRSPWPAMMQFLLTILVSVGFAWVCESQSFYFYPLALFFIGSRIFALSLIGHEAIHGLIFQNKKANFLFAQYFCHFPTFISTMHYSQMHFLHHRFTKTDRDPDVYTYNLAWESRKQWAWEKLKELLSGKIFLIFTGYFMGFPHFLRKDYPFRRNADHLQLMLFWLAVALILTVFGGWKLFFLYWFLPFYIWLPWVQLVNGYQHVGDDRISENGTRSFQLKWSFLNRFVFPLSTHLHEAHHRDATVPFYQLAEMTEKQKYQIYLTSEVDTLIFKRRFLK